MVSVIDRIGAFGQRFAPRGVVPRHAARTAIAALAAEAATWGLGLPQGYWAVISAISVVQLTIGATLGTALDRMLGTATGAALGMLGLWLCATQPVAPWVVLAGVVALGAYAGAAHPSLRIAAITGAIILLGPSGNDEPTASGLARVADVVLGSLIGVAISAVLLPSHANADVNRKLAATLGACAELLVAQVARLNGAGHDPRAIDALNGTIRAGLVAADTLAAEARRELAGHLATHPDPAALVRAVRRIWHSIIIVGRAAGAALPPPVLGPVWPAFEALAGALRSAVLDSAAGLGRPQPPPTLASPSLSALDGAQQALAQAIDTLRTAGTLRSADSATVARLFTTWFALEQVVRDLQELADRLGDQAPSLLNGARAD